MYVSVFLPVPYCFDYCSFKYSLKSGSVIPPALFFLVKIALAIQGLFWLHTNFRIMCSSSVKNAFGIFIEIAFNLWIALGTMHILALLIIPIHEQNISFHLFAPSLLSFISVL